MTVHHCVSSFRSNNNTTSPCRILSCKSISASKSYRHSSKVRTGAGADDDDEEEFEGVDAVMGAVVADAVSNAGAVGTSAADDDEDDVSEAAAGARTSI